MILLYSVFVPYFFSHVILVVAGRQHCSYEHFSQGGGQWAVGSEQWAVGSGQWTVDSGQWTVDSGGAYMPVPKMMVASEHFPYYALSFC